MLMGQGKRSKRPQLGLWDGGGKNRGKDRNQKRRNSVWKMASAFGILFIVFLFFIAGKSIGQFGGKGERCWVE